MSIYFVRLYNIILIYSFLFVNSHCKLLDKFIVDVILKSSYLISIVWIFWILKLE
jgi:hypothetical protein